MNCAFIQQELIEKLKFDEPNILNVFFNGVVLRNGVTKLGIGIHVSNLDGYDVSMGVIENKIPHTSSDQIKLVSFNFALKQALKIQNSYPDKFQKIIMHTNSLYAFNVMKLFTKNNDINKKHMFHENNEDFLIFFDIIKNFGNVEIVWNYFEVLDKNLFIKNGFVRALNSAQLGIKQIQDNNLYKSNSVITEKCEFKPKQTSSLDIYCVISRLANSAKAVGVGIHCPRHSYLDQSLAYDFSKKNYDQYDLSILISKFTFQLATEIIEMYPNCYDQVIIHINEPVSEKKQNLNGLKVLWDDTKKNCEYIKTAHYLAYNAALKEIKEILNNQSNGNDIENIINNYLPIEEIKILKIFCDGSYSEKPNSVGVGVVFPSHPDFNLSYGLVKCHPISTPTQVEIIAAIIAIKRASELISKFPNEYETIRMHTDSLDIINEISSEKKLDFCDDSLKLFKGLFIEIDKLELPIEWLHVKGHAGDIYNQKADELANQGRKNALNKIYK